MGEEGVMPKPRWTPLQAEAVGSVIFKFSFFDIKDSGFVMLLFNFIVSCSDMLVGWQTDSSLPPLCILESLKLNNILN